MMNQETAQNPQPFWFSQTKALFFPPNPKIFGVFVSSSLATFILGTAMFIEWILYSRFQEGFHWIIYYASFLIAFPLIVWTVSAVAAVVFINKHRKLDISPLSDSNTESEKVQIDQEQDQTVEDHQLAIVKVDQAIDDDDDDYHRVCDLIKELPKWVDRIDDSKMLKRTTSCPFVGTTSSAGKDNRRVSF